MTTNNRTRLRQQFFIGGGWALGLLLLLTVTMRTTVAVAQPIEPPDQPRISQRQMITPTLSIRAFPATASIERVARTLTGREPAGALVLPSGALSRSDLEDPA